MQRCIFLIATPGSGSSFMRSAIENRTGCVMSGENWGAFLSLSEMHDRIRKTISMQRFAKDQHAKDAWKLVFHPAEVTAAEHRLATALLNPHNRSCWGFKEIRYGRNNVPGTHTFPPALDTFVRDLQYLAGLCHQPRFVLHRRRSLARELQKHAVDKFQERQKNQWRCFDNYCNASLATGNSTICRRPAGVPSVPIFQHTLEDLLENNDRNKALWNFVEGNLPEKFSNCM